MESGICPRRSGVPGRTSSLPVESTATRGRRWTATVLAVLALLAGTALTIPGAATAAPAAWTPKPAPMTTPWTNQVPVDNPLPEYPRPQLTRPDWANLNGIWDFAVTSADAGRSSTASGSTS